MLDKKVCYESAIVKGSNLGFRLLIVFGSIGSSELGSDIDKFLLLCITGLGLHSNSIFIFFFIYKGFLFLILKKKKKKLSHFVL